MEVTFASNLIPMEVGSQSTFMEVPMEVDGNVYERRSNGSR